MYYRRKPIKKQSNHLTAAEGVVQLMESCVEATMSYQSVNEKAQVSEYGVSMVEVMVVYCLSLHVAFT
jgi:hypothetical protein